MAPVSILNSVKKNLDLEEDNVDFDDTIIMHINSAFSTLHQLGIGPAGGYEIEDADATWDAFYGTNKRYNSIRTYVTMYVRNIFDPPQTGHHAAALDRQMRELEWRLNVLREEAVWVPDPGHIRTIVLDGGDA